MYEKTTEPENKSVVLTTTVVISITNSTATSGGVICSTGSSAVTARGVCWSSVSQAPTVSDRKTKLIDQLSSK